MFIKKKMWIEAFSTLIYKPKPIITPTMEVYHESGLHTIRKSAIVYVGLALIILLGFSMFFSQSLMIVLGALAFSIMPVAILFAWVLKTDRYEPEPRSLIIAAIGLGGVLAALFSMIGFPRDLMYHFSKIALIEIAFFLILVGLDSNKVTGREFNDHLDGAVYGLSLGLGYVLYDNFMKIYLTPTLFNPLLLTLLSVEDLFVSIFPALTGWWIGYVKAKYTSTRFLDLLAGFIPIVIVRVFYESLLIAVSVIDLVSRLIIVIVVGTMIMSILVRRIEWALEDEKIWGYHMGKAPVERGVNT